MSVALIAQRAPHDTALLVIVKRRERLGLTFCPSDKITIRRVPEVAMAVTFPADRTIALALPSPTLVATLASSCMACVVKEAHGAASDENGLLDDCRKRHEPFSCEGLQLVTWSKVQEIWRKMVWIILTVGR